MSATTLTPTRAPSSLSPSSRVNPHPQGRRTPPACFVLLAGSEECFGWLRWPLAAGSLIATVLLVAGADRLRRVRRDHGRDRTFGQHPVGRHVGQCDG